MFNSWSIRNKLLLGVLTLLVSVGMLAFSGFRCAYSYRDLAKSITVRASELPLAAELHQRIGDMRVALSRIRDARSFDRRTGNPSLDTQILREDFRISFLASRESLSRYRTQLNANIVNDPLIGDNRRELSTVSDIEAALAQAEAVNADFDWVLDDIKVEKLDEQLEAMHRKAQVLPTFLQQRMHDFAGEVRGRYRMWITLNCISLSLAALLLFSLGAYFYTSVFGPLRRLVHHSRFIADGQFDHRIRIEGKDEVSEVGIAMNNMTDSFQEIRDSLDAQVKQRTKEVIRNEQLASVGFLAAGVAHEINNPLASIAWCAESLESRMHDIIFDDDELPDEESSEEIAVLKKYLQRIQDEAFRCKGITDSLLDYSRMSDVEKNNTNLAELVEGVIEMVRHLGKFREKNIEFQCDGLVNVAVNPQEIKQVVLNLITNGLDSLDPGGTVSIRIRARGESAELCVEDDGCGMSDEVLAHLFEPFFTRRRDGQGTGLGLSITYRIIADHGGKLEAFSDGPGKGSRFRIALPLVNHEKEKTRQAA